MAWQRPLRSGFALAEAVVMIVVVSSLAIPIGSLMWQMTGKAVDLEEKALARQMALGVQANILAYGAFSESVDYSVPDAVSTRGATLTAILTWDKNVTGMGFLGPVNTGLVANPQRMAAYRIDVERLANPDLGIEAASLTFLTGVVFSEVREADLDLVYAAVPSQKRIFAIHPIDHDTWDFYDTATYTPLHLAVHPNGGWLAIKCPQSILLMDIRANSPTLGSFTIIYHDSTANSVCGSSNDDTTGDQNTRLDRGIAFRSDGKYLYWSQNSPSHIYVLRAPANFPPPPGTLSPPWVPLTTGTSEWLTPFPGGPDSMELINGEDGFLYWAFRKSAPGTNRLNTHTHVCDINLAIPWPPSIITAPENQLQRGVTTSWDGGEVLYWNGSCKLGGYLSHAPTHFWAGTVSSGDLTAPGDQNQPNGLLVSRDNRFILGGSSKTGAVKHLYAWNRREYNTSWDLSTTPNIATRTLGDLPITSLVHSSYGKEVIADTTGNQILFINVASFVATSTTPAMASWTPDSVSGPGNVSAIAARVPEMAWIACADGIVRSLDIYGGQIATIGGQLSGINVGIGSIPLTIALTAGGDRAIVCHQGAGNYPVLIDLLAYPPTWSPLTSLSPYPTVATPTIAAFTQRGSLIVGFRQTGFSLKSPGISVNNGFLVYPANADGTLNMTATCGYALPSNFVLKEIVPFNRREGALILFQDTTSPQKDSVIVWVEPSAQGGTSGTGAGGPEGSPNWRILSVWEGRYDGFPEGAPCKMALSPDDTLLATLDLTNAAGNTRNVIRIYDLTNQRFPMQLGMGEIRYNSHTGHFNQALKDNPVNIKNIQCRFNSQFDSNYTYNFFAPGSNTYFHLTTNRYFSYWYAPLSCQRIGATSCDGIRLFINGSPPNLLDSTRTLWTDSAYNAYYLWDASSIISPSPLCHFQAEIFNSDANECNMAFGWTNTSLGKPNSYSVSSNFISSLKTDSSPWTLMRVEDFRLFRFRPQLLYELFMDGSIWEGDPSITTDDLNLPTLSGGPEGWYAMCFHRDTARPTLFLITHDGSFPFTDKLTGLGLFGSPNWGIKNVLPDANIKWNMAVSPDGRRLVLTAADSAPRNLIHLFDISYPFPWAAPNLATVATHTIELPAAPLALGVRPFNSFTSKPDSFDSFPNVSGAFVNRCGNQTAALAHGGIYIVGGSDGHTGAALHNVYCFNPLIHSASSRTPIPLPLAHPAIVSDNGKILAIGGRTTNDVSNVYSYDPNLNAWTLLQSLQENDNVTTYPVSQAASALTPYGLILIGGVAQTEVWAGHITTWGNGFTDTATINYANAHDCGGHGSYVNLLCGQSGHSPNGGGCNRGCFTFKGPNPDGKIPFDATTSFVASFTCRFNSPGGGICMVFQRTTADNIIGLATQLGYGGDGFGVPGVKSFALAIDGANDRIALCQQGSLANVSPWITTFQLDTGSPNYFWVEYDSSTTRFKVWANNVNDKTTANLYIDQAYNLRSNFTSDDLWLGFTGGGNSDACNHEACIDMFSIRVVRKNTSSNVKIYYPQVFKNPNWGQTMAMPSLTDGPKANGAAVCHFSRKEKKWYLYLIGGGTDPGQHDGKLIRRFNFETNTWDASWDLGDNNLTERTQAAACSWGDEIFIYGGCRSNVRTNTGIAFNPDTQTFRTLTSTGDNYCVNMTAVPAGPHIYLINGCDAANATGGGSTWIRRYSP